MLSTLSLTLTSNRVTRKSLSKRTSRFNTSKQSSLTSIGEEIADKTHLKLDIEDLHISELKETLRYKRDDLEIIDLNIPFLFGTREEQMENLYARFGPRDGRDVDSVVKSTHTEEKYFSNGVTSVVVREDVKYKDPQFQPDVTSFGCNVNYKKNIRSPTSPHIFIYKLPLAAITSIMNRITGMAMGGTLFLAASACLFFNTPDVVNCISELVTKYWFLAPMVKFPIAFPIVYHTLGGLRHFFWDFSAKGLESNKIIYASSAFLLGFSFVLSALLSIVHF
eukprot:TRINITY_DN835_c0_g1_i1.p1 TRINITY_DN835_c0_g1~~TRINITY_DN835_c0_g1_i1.p1  ORF type:complete len:293 (+),score=69.28 TRINITY_DN835_c0_g1_i1:43-879(+)